MFRRKHVAWLTTAFAAMALGGAGVALAASGNSGTKSGASTTATTTQQSSSGHHCDGDNSSS